MMRYAIWYHLYNLKLQAESLHFFKSNAPRWVFFTLLKLVEMVPNRAKHHICIYLLTLSSRSKHDMLMQ